MKKNKDKIALIIGNIIIPWSEKLAVF